MKIYKCDKCGTMLDTDHRTATVGARTFDLCSQCKFEFNDLIEKFFNLKKDELKHFRDEMRDAATGKPTQEWKL